MEAGRRCSTLMTMTVSPEEDEQSFVIVEVEKMYCRSIGLCVLHV